MIRNLLLTVASSGLWKIKRVKETEGAFHSTDNSENLKRGAVIS